MMQPLMPIPKPSFSTAHSFSNEISFIVLSSGNSAKANYCSELIIYSAYVGRATYDGCTAQRKPAILRCLPNEI